MTIFIVFPVLMSWNPGDTFDRHDPDPDINEARKKRIRYLHYEQADGQIFIIPCIEKDPEGDEP